MYFSGALRLVLIESTLYFYLLVLVQLMVKVLLQNFRDCQMKHARFGSRMLRNHISSHLCVNKDACVLGLVTLLKYFSINSDGKLAGYLITVISYLVRARVFRLAMIVCKKFGLFWRRIIFQFVSRVSKENYASSR